MLKPIPGRAEDADADRLAAMAERYLDMAVGEGAPAHRLATGLALVSIAASLRGIEASLDRLTPGVPR